MNSRIFVTHWPCRDGNTASYVAWTKFTDSADYLYEAHGDYKITQELLALPDIKDKHITYIDICPPRDMLTKLNNLAGKVEVWDHHKTAAENCGDLPYVYIDQTKSGAGIAWDKLYQTEPPFLIQLVQDADLWQWKIPNADEYLLWIETHRFSFKKWDKIDSQLSTEEGRNAILLEGRAYKKFRNHLVGRIITNRKIHWAYFPKCGTKLPAINAPLMQSMIGNALCTRKNHQGAAVYYRGNGQYYFSLRSTNDGPDVSKIAKKYGGGGHRNASGFVCRSLSQLDAPQSASTMTVQATEVQAYQELTGKLPDIIFSEMTEEEIKEFFPDLEEDLN